jgi:hypothetical protein
MTTFLPFLQAVSERLQRRLHETPKVALQGSERLWQWRNCKATREVEWLFVLRTHQVRHLISGDYIKGLPSVPREESYGEIPSAKLEWWYNNYCRISYGNRVVAPTAVVMHPARHTPWQGAIP